MLGEKARRELYKDAACCFEQILEAELYKTAAVWPLTSHLTNHNDSTWIKTGLDNFDIPMGGYDSAQISDLVGLYIYIY